MKIASPALLALFATNQHFEQFDLYTITLTSGYVLRYANCNFDVIYGGNTFLCARSVGGVPIESADDGGPRAHWTCDLNVGTWQVSVMPRPNDVIGNQPWLWAVSAGMLDESIVRVDRGYVTDWPATPTLTLVPAGTINVFYGRMAGIDFGRSVVQLNMNDPRELLATDQPRNLFSAGCRDALFGPVCRLNRAAFADPTTALAVTNSQQFIANVPLRGQIDGYYSLGEIVFTSGDNIGLRMMVRQSRAYGNIYLIAPMPFDIDVGDAFTLYPGCDKQRTTCIGKFNNVANYFGEPFIPAAETAI